MTQKVINLTGSKIILPSYEIAREEKRIWVLYLYPEDWFQKRQRIILATEIATPDERLWNDWDKFSQVVGSPIANFVLVLFFIEMFKYGITNYDDMIPYWEDFAHAPDWIEFCNAILEARKNKDWWERVKPKFEELKRIEWDELKAKGKFIGKINFAFPEHRETIEEIRDELWDIVQVNAFIKLEENFGERWEDYWKLTLKLLDEHHKRSREASLVIAT